MLSFEYKDRGRGQAEHFKKEGFCNVQKTRLNWGFATLQKSTRKEAQLMRYGYARTSTDDQTTALQLAALKKARCAHIFEDGGQSGASTKRPALARCLKTLRAGDTLTVWKMDRLGRSLADLIAILDDLKGRGVRFQSLTEAIDTETPTGRAMWQMIGILAELERSIITERTRAGVKAAQRRGVKFGRPAALTAAQIDHARKLIRKGEARSYVAGLLKVSTTTLYRALLKK